MKNFSTAVMSVLSQRYGLEPLTVIGIKWKDDTEVLYADREIDGVEGRILQVSDMETIVSISSNSKTEQISIKLDDFDGQLKSIYDIIDIHSRPVKIYQIFGSLPLSEKVLIFEGEIASPVTWSEGDRTLSFDVVTKLANAEVGFSPEEGFFPDLLPDQVGKPWPLCFGTVNRVQAIATSDIPDFTALSDIQNTDPSLNTKIDELDKSIDSLVSFLIWVIIAEGACALTCDFGTTAEQVRAACAQANQLHSLQMQLNSKITELRQNRLQLLETRSDQDDASTNTIKISPNSTYVGDVTSLNIGNVKYNGAYDQNTGVFTIDNATPNDYEYDSLNPYGVINNTAGQKATVNDGYLEVKYIANILPSEVLSVEVYNRETESLVMLSNNYWSVENIELSDPDIPTEGKQYTVTVVKLTQPPNTINAAYSKEIYVTLRSSIGPNPIDIIEWLIGKYTTFVVDRTSFDVVKTILETYPMHFCIIERKDIVTMLEELAWQAKCAIWISNNVVYIKYLAKKYTPVATISLSDIDASSLTLTTVNTDDLVTKFISNWVTDYQSNTTNSIILRHNVSKYGTHEQTYDMYAYTIQELVEVVSTFWLIRYSNCWKRVSFTTPIHLLYLEAFDTVTLDLGTIVANEPVNGLIESMIYDSDNSVLKFSVWVPVKLGTMVEYDFAQPHEIDVTLTFPTPQEITEGTAGNRGPGEDNVDTNINRNLSYTTATNQRTIYNSIIENRLNTSKRRPHYGTSVLSDTGRTMPQTYTTYSSPEDVIVPYDGEYEYKDTSFEPETAEVQFDVSASYPARVLESLGEALYCEIFTMGLDSPPEEHPVRQLQIAEGTVVPVGSWCLVAQNKIPDFNTSTGEITYEDEWVVQVPVWL